MLSRANYTMFKKLVLFAIRSDPFKYLLYAVYSAGYEWHCDFRLRTWIIYHISDIQQM